MAALHAGSAVLLDGGFATQCEEEGEDLSSVLWSALLLEEKPDVVKAVHAAYALAGAQVLITATYQASVGGFASLGINPARAEACMRSSVTIARKALAESGAHGLVAGSIGPYGAAMGGGAEYRGDYVQDSREHQAEKSPTTPVMGAEGTITPSQLAEWHVPRLAALAKEAPDLLACETLPCIAEVTAIGQALASLPSAAQTPVWCSFTLTDAATLPSGESVHDAVKTAVEVFGGRLLGVGCNCVPPSVVPAFLVHATEALQAAGCSLRRLAGLDDLLRAVAECQKGAQGPTAHAVCLITYPNAGEAWDVQEKTWVALGPEHGEAATPGRQAFVEQAEQWVASGASLVGGCCRVGPAVISALKQALSLQPPLPSG